MKENGQAAMATRVTSTRPARQSGGGGPKFPGPNGKGPSGNGHKRDSDAKEQFSPWKYKLTIWIVLAAVVMMFAALSSSYIILSGGEKWQPVRMPRMFYASTVVIVLSSFCFEVAKSSFRHLYSRYRSFLWITFLLGLSFVALQLLGWHELSAQGVYVNEHPHRSFFYIFTAIHGVHLIGGIAALAFLLVRSSRGDEKQAVYTSATAFYWHFMDGLWVWLFALLLFWR
jgi:cytochrome c oxidase subunit III